MVLDEGGIDYNTALSMDYDEIIEANEALDYKKEKEKQQMKEATKKKKGKK